MDSGFSKVFFLFFRRMRAPLIVLISPIQFLSSV